MQAREWIGLTILGMISLPGVAQATILTVEDLPGTMTEIQDAVDAAADGDAISVGPGEYNGAAVWKSVEIVGSGPDLTSINCSLSPYGVGFLIVANGVSISNFGFSVEAAQTGVIVVASNATIRRNRFAHGPSLPAGSVAVGIFASGTSATDNTVLHNTIAGFDVGVILASFGPLVRDNVVASNVIASDFGDCAAPDSALLGPGIALLAAGAAPAAAISQNQLIQNDIDYQNGFGILLYDGDWTRVDRISQNVIAGNDLVGSGCRLRANMVGLIENNVISRNPGQQP